MKSYTIGYKLVGSTTEIRFFYQVLKSSFWVPFHWRSLVLFPFFYYKMHFTHRSVINILKAMGPRYTLVIRYWCDAWALQACGAELPWSVQPTQALRYAGSGSSAKRADSSAKIKLVAKIRPTWHWYWPYDLTNICPYNSKHIEMYFNIFPFTDYISDISKIWVPASSKVSWSGIVSL